MNQPSLDDIRLFVSVVQAGSLSQAAQLTGVDVSRLSRRLTQLENALGTQLINRGKKGISTNELGEQFFIHAVKMLQEADTAIDSIRKSLARPAGLLRISIATDIAHQYLLPVLDDYLVSHPDVRIELNLNQEKINIIQDGIDIAIRVGAINNDNAVARVWQMVEFGIYATADYLASHGTPQTPDELHQHKIIAQTMSLPWHFQKGLQSIGITPDSYFGCNDFTITDQMIVNGLGIGKMNKKSAACHPNLVAVLTDWHIAAQPVSLVYYKNRGTTPVIQSFIHWLLNNT